MAAEQQYTMISSYKNSFDTHGKDMPIDAFIRGVLNGQWQDDVIAVRRIQDKKERSNRKKNVPMVTISGSFEDRKEAGLRKHSGFIAIDIDNIEENINGVKALLRTDPYIYALFTSISGSGLCAIMKIEGENHREAFEGIGHYLYEKFQLVIDPMCKNISRGRYVSWDEELFSNPSALTFKKYLPKKKALKIDRVVYVESDFDAIIKEFYDRGINICEEYNQWISIGYSIYDQFKDSQQGRDYFHTLSSLSARYNSDQTDKVYDNIAKSYSEDKGTRATIATIYYHAKLNGIQTYSDNTKKIIASTATLKRSGLRPDKIVENLQKFEGIQATESQDIVAQAFAKDIEVANEESIICEVERWLKYNCSLKRNSITRMIEDNGKELHEKDMNSLFISAKKAIEKLDYTLFERIVMSNNTPDFNPILDFFKDYKDRNETGLIDQLIDTVETPNEEFAAYFFKKWIVSIIASAHGTHSPLMFILAGEKQNSGKCLAKDTGILMYDTTIKKVQDIVSGDLLMGPDSKPRRVLSTCYGYETMYKVDQVNGNAYIVNESHILSLKDRITKEVLNITVKDYYKRYGEKISKYKGYKADLKIKYDIDLPIDPYLLGLWLGDGQSNVKSGIKIESMDDEIILFLENYCIEHKLFLSKYEQNGSRSSSYNIVNGYGRGTGKKDNKNLKATFRALNLSNNKHIPFIYRKASNKQRLELLAGIVDSDGYIGQGMCEIVQKREQLSDDILFLARSLGFKCTKTKKAINGVNYFRVFLSGALDNIPCKVKRKQIISITNRDASMTSIKVTKLDVDQYFGFSLDGDRLFCLEDFTVTHNTEFFRRLFPSELKPYYAESKLDGGKDDFILMTQALLILDDEMSGKSKQESNAIKSITSKQIFNLREPYGRSRVNLVRLAVLCGTTNNLAIINDPTGNRRFIPIEVLSINHHTYNKIDKVDLIMEAYHLYKSGFNWRLSSEDIEYLKASTDKMNDYSLEFELIQRYITKPEHNDYNAVEKTATEIKVYLEHLTNQRISLKKLGEELKGLGFIQQVKKINGKTTKLYKVVLNDERPPTFSSTDMEPTAPF